MHIILVKIDQEQKKMFSYPLAWLKKDEDCSLILAKAVDFIIMLQNMSPQQTVYHGKKSRLISIL